MGRKQYFLLMDFKMCRLNEPCNPRKLVLYTIKKYLQYFKDNTVMTMSTCIKTCLL